MRRLAVVLTVSIVVLVVTATTADAGGGGGCEGGHRKELATTHVDIQQYCFTQTVAHVAPGATVTWTNRDETPHMVTGIATEWGDYESIQSQQSVSHTFGSPGVYPYVCILHPGMAAVIVVDGDAPATELAAATNPITADRDGGSMLAWIVAGALAGLVAVVVTSVIVTRRRSPVTA